MKYFEITRHLEFDAGHRIPNHTGQCRHLHGHRYQIEVTLRGVLSDVTGSADEGMIMDFGEIKRIMQETIVTPWDHSFFVAQSDLVMLEFLKTIPDHKTVVLQQIPTAENLAQAAFDLLAPKLNAQFGNKIKLRQLRLYETPNCWADVIED